MTSISRIWLVLMQWTQRPTSPASPGSGAPVQEIPNRCENNSIVVVDSASPCPISQQAQSLASDSYGCDEFRGSGAPLQEVPSIGENSSIVDVDGAPPCPTPEQPQLLGFDSSGCNEFGGTHNHIKGNVPAEHCALHVVAQSTIRVLSLNRCATRLITMLSSTLDSNSSFSCARQSTAGVQCTTSSRTSSMWAYRQVHTFRGEAKVDEVSSNAGPVLDTEMRDVFHKRQSPLGCHLARTHETLPSDLHHHLLVHDCHVICTCTRILLIKVWLDQTLNHH